MKKNLIKTEKRIMDGLKDFQRATVERVFQLYKHEQKRVLVADEVGLGKTLIAKGLIAKMVRDSYKENERNPFKVVYICSNQTIANQNINKLKIDDKAKIEGTSDTRLSMQHLRVFEQEKDVNLQDKYLQITPLTPHTSFSTKRGCGMVYERALIFAFLKRIDIFKDYIRELEIIFIDRAQDSWKEAREEYEERVIKCDNDNKGKYINTIKEQVKELIQEKNLVEDIRELLHKVRENNYERIHGTYYVIHKLRMIFAEVSVEFLNPDLVIMDEFQRFKFLMDNDKSSETGILVDRFLKRDDTRVLLLSATPYKLYSTLEEINESQIDDHYEEFFQVFNFLIDDKKEEDNFKDIWENFSFRLREIKFNETSIIEAKNKAEEEMYKVMCRTERISEVDIEDFIDDSSTKKTIEVTEKDILSYIEAEGLLKNTVEKGSIPIDYVKSSPYLLSFMRNYKSKKQIEEYFIKKNEEIKKVDKDSLWIDEKVISTYGELDKDNAKLELLKDLVFKDESEMLLWVPASKPYYKPQGVFEDIDNFSKVLVFSAWKMVPRMISTLISYEAERKTVGKYISQDMDNNSGYFTPNQKRAPLGRLYFNFTDNIPYSMSMFCLLYPSKFLADLYDPIYYLNKGKTFKEIEKELTLTIDENIRKISKFQYLKETGREDERWYYLAPLLMDYKAYVNSWFENGSDLISESLEDTEERGKKGFNIHLNKLKEYYESADDIGLGKMPSDLVQVLVKMAMASPAICSYRANGENGLYATQTAKMMINMFNRQEAISIIELSYDIKDLDYWKKVLSYCQDGNLQAVFDEYVHMLIESHSLKDSINKYDIIHPLIINTVQTRSVSYKVDTYNKFKDIVRGKKGNDIYLRSHYAVSFDEDERESKVGIDRKESVRNSFNSPFRPFVLSTTSIGQEGLDFHFYCRKIMHWNLPSNPIDLEQREGRVNRFKCHAIRQNIALEYKDKIQFKKDVWSELFKHAQDEYKGQYSELIPFWSLPNNRDIKIERIVPLYPLSKDIGGYERLIKILSLYRLTLGQPRQEDLLEHVLKTNGNDEMLEELFINLSPYFKNSDLKETKNKTLKL